MDIVDGFDKESPVGAFSACDCALVVVSVTGNGSAVIAIMVDVDNLLTAEVACDSIFVDSVLCMGSTAGMESLCSEE